MEQSPKTRNGDPLSGPPFLIDFRWQLLADFSRLLITVEQLLYTEGEECSQTEVE